MLKDYFLGILKNRYILANLVRLDIKRKYRGSALGVLWNVLMPLGIVLIIGFIYAIIFSVDPKIFIPTLFAGLNTWIFISGAADAGTMSLLSAEGYIKQTNVNAQIYPLRTTLVGFVAYLYSLLAFFIMYIFLQPSMFGINMLMVIPGMLLMLLFSLGVSNLAAIINLNIRDFQPLQSLFFQGMFYATPVIFPPEMLARRGFAVIYELNPFYYIIEVVRAPLLGQSLPSIQEYFIATILSLVIFFVSIIVFMRAKNTIALKL